MTPAALRISYGLPARDQGTCIIVSFPAGSASPSGEEFGDVGMVHAIDGDGSSLCDIVAKGVLVTVDNYGFQDAPQAQRCLMCEALARP